MERSQVFWQTEHRSSRHDGSSKMRLAADPDANALIHFGVMCIPDAEYLVDRVPETEYRDRTPDHQFTAVIPLGSVSQCLSLSVLRLNEGKL